MQIEWKVPAHRSDAMSSPNSVLSRDFISPAALLVNVMARIVHGGQGLSMYSLSRASKLSRSSEDAPSSLAMSLSERPAGSRSEKYALPYLIMYAIRCTSTVVLPLPAPASTSSGPFTVKTASRCLSFKLPYNWSKAARFDAIKRSAIPEG